MCPLELAARKRQSSADGNAYKWQGGRGLGRHNNGAGNVGEKEALVAMLEGDPCFSSITTEVSRQRKELGTENKTMASGSEDTVIEWYRILENTRAHE